MGLPFFPLSNNTCLHYDRSQIAKRRGMGDRVRQGSLASQLQTCLKSAPTDIMDFIEACTMGNVDRVEKLIEKGVDVNQKGEWGNSGLMMAAMENQVEVLDCLLRLDNIDVNMTAIQGNTALTYAAAQGNSIAVSQLVKSGANVSVTTTSGKTSISLATSRANLATFLDVVGILVMAGCKPTKADGP